MQSRMERWIVPWLKFPENSRTSKTILFYTFPFPLSSTVKYLGYNSRPRWVFIKCMATLWNCENIFSTPRLCGGLNAWIFSTPEVLIDGNWSLAGELGRSSKIRIKPTHSPAVSSLSKTLSHIRKENSFGWVGVCQKRSASKIRIKPTHSPTVSSLSKTLMAI